MSGETEAVQLMAETTQELEEKLEEVGLALGEEVDEDRAGSLKEEHGANPDMEGANNEAFEEVLSDENQPPRDVEDISGLLPEEEPAQTRRRSTLSGSVESLLEKSGMVEHAETLESNGYDKMQTLSLASKDDLMASGLKRGHASLMVHLTVGKLERLKKEKEVAETDDQDISVEPEAEEEGKMDKEKKPNGNGYEVIAVDTVTTQVAERGNWGRQLDYILSCVGYAVGLGNIWRFPYLCYRHGGGVFLIPYIIMLFLAGMPLFFLETAFGQYASQGPVTIWRACPLFAGIGWAMVIISAMVVIYYNIIMAWTAFFIFKSFTLELPWSDCDNWWNTENCGYALPPNGTMINGTWWNQTLVEMMNITVPDRVTPAEEYWNKIVLDKSDGIEDLGPVRWQMALCLLLAWAVVFLCICRGVKSSGKVVYFTATFPYIILVCLLIRALTLEGASKGIGYYMNADWQLLKKSKVWNDAASQIFYSLGPAWGGVLTFSSYNKFNHNCFRDAIMVPFINCGTSIFAGFVVFATLGFMSVKTGMDIEDVAIQGPGLVFVTYPEAIAQMPLAPLWSFLFFFMLFLVGLDTQFGMTETVISGFIDQFPNQLRKRKTLVALGICFLFFLLGLPLVTRGGIFVFELINWYSAWISLMIVGMSECFAIGYFYGVCRFIGDIKRMLGYETVVWYWYCLCWLFVTPGIILFIIGFGIYKYVPVYYGSYTYPAWGEALGWVMAVIAPLMIPIFMVINFLKAEGQTLRERFSNAIKPTKEWDIAHGQSQETGQAQVPLTQYKMATNMNGTKPGQPV